MVVGTLVVVMALAGGGWAGGKVSRNITDSAHMKKKSKQEKKKGFSNLEQVHRHSCRLKV